MRLLLLYESCLSCPLTISFNLIYYLILCEQVIIVNKFFP